jgi:hypothetical protein
VAEATGGGLRRLRERAEACECLKERLAPGPAARQVQAQAAGVAGEPAGDVQQPVAEAFRFAAGERAVEQQPLRPGEQIPGGEDELEPGGVRLEGAEGEIVEAGVPAAADPVFDDGVVAVQLFEPLDPAALLVGDEDLEAVAVVVAEGERLRPRASLVSRLSLLHRPGTRGPRPRLTTARTTSASSRSSRCTTQTTSIGISS